MNVSVKNVDIIVIATKSVLNVLTIFVQVVNAYIASNKCYPPHEKWSSKYKKRA